MAIPVKSLMTEVDNLPGEETAFTIGDPRWVMQTLADLYSNKELAVTREYSTNARDAHIEAGKANVPIEVTLPSLYDPYFTVQDYGIGMSEEELTEVYTKFGDSTKRGSNSYNGMLGFGSKSAIAYTNQFTIVAVKNGIETIGVITRKPDYSIVLKVVASGAADKPNGVQVKIPVHNHEEFSHKARDFYRFWKPGTVLVNGAEPKQAVGEKIDENLYFSPQPGTSYVVMGNVGYRIANPDALFRNAKMNKISFVAYVNTCDCDRHLWMDIDGEEYSPHAAVEFTPSREDLKYTDHTKKTLQKIITDFEAKILVEAKTKIETAQTAQEAWKLWDGWGQKIGHELFRGMEWNGNKFVQAFNTRDTTRYQVPSRNGYNPRYNTYSVNNWEVGKSDSTLFVIDFQSDRADGISISVEASHKKKVREYFEHVGKDIKHVLFSKKAQDCFWIPQDNVITWEDLKAAVPRKVRVPQANNRPKRPKGLFDFFTIKGKSYEEPIPDDADLFYITAQDAKKYSVGEALNTMGADKDVVVVVLAVNRVDKFKRDNFAVREFIPWAKKKVILDSETLLDDRAKLALNLGETTINWLKALDTKTILDPKWKVVKELLDHREFNSKYEKNFELARCLGMAYDVKQYRPSRSDNSLIDKYPLLQRINHWNLRPADRSEIILYMNASYEAQKGKP